jgi:RNA polymerase sigma-70 factor (ECF subfamily)
MDEPQNDQEVRRQLGRFHADSFGWALNCCAGNPEEAEEVLQTAYLKVLSGKARYGGRSSFRTWLFSVIRLTAADRRRRFAVRRNLLERWWSEAPPEAPQEGDPESTAGRQRIGERLRAAVATLPRRQQEILQLVFYHDHTVAEAAEVMGVSLGSARTHYHRGKQGLRSLIQERQLDV